MYGGGNAQMHGIVKKKYRDSGYADCRCLVACSARLPATCPPSFIPSPTVPATAHRIPYPARQPDKWL